MARILRSGGVTLAETLLALGLCVVVVLLAIQLGITALHGGQKGTDQSVANGWGSRVLAEFVYGLPPGTDPFWASTSYASPYQVDTTQLNGKDFKAELFLSEVPGAGGGLKQVTVNVTWDGGQNKGNYGRQATSMARLVYAQ